MFEPLPCFSFKLLHLALEGIDKFCLSARATNTLLSDAKGSVSNKSIKMEPWNNRKLILFLVKKEYSYAVAKQKHREIRGTKQETTKYLKNKYKHALCSPHSGFWILDTVKCSLRRHWGEGWQPVPIDQKHFLCVFCYSELPCPSEDTVWDPGSVLNWWIRAVRFFLLRQTFLSSPLMYLNLQCPKYLGLVGSTI